MHKKNACFSARLVEQIRFSSIFPHPHERATWHLQAHCMLLNTCFRHEVHVTRLVRSPTLALAPPCDFSQIRRYKTQHLQLPIPVCVVVSLISRMDSVFCPELINLHFYFNLEAYSFESKADVAGKVWCSFVLHFQSKKKRKKFYESFFFFF